MQKKMSNVTIATRSPLLFNFYPKSEEKDSAYLETSADDIQRINCHCCCYSVKELALKLKHLQTQRESQESEHGPSSYNNGSFPHR